MNKVKLSDIPEEVKWVWVMTSFEIVWGGARTFKKVQDICNKYPEYFPKYIKQSRPRKNKKQFIKWFFNLK